LSLISDIALKEKLSLETSAKYVRSQDFPSYPIRLNALTVLRMLIVKEEMSFQ